jgi:hypothetical protein
MIPFFGQRDPTTPTISEDIETLEIAEANELCHGYLFDTVVSRQGTWVANDSLPLISDSICHILIPYRYDLHGSVILNGFSLEHHVSNFINSEFPKEKFVFSCDCDFFSRFEFFHLTMITLILELKLAAIIRIL